VLGGASLLTLLPEYPKNWLETIHISGTIFTLLEMDPLSLTVSITALLGTTAQIIQYRNDIRDASKEKRALASEAANLLGLLTALKYRAEEAEQSQDPWYTGIQGLGGEGGPLEQFRKLLEKLAAKLEPLSGIRKAGKTFLWTLDKAEINNILARIERLKTLIDIALNKDHLYAPLPFVALVLEHLLRLEKSPAEEFHFVTRTGVDSLQCIISGHPR
jgi:hypothetical protein